MSLHSQATAMLLWCSQPALQAAVAVIMWRRKMHKQFPLFFSFLLVQLVIFGATFPLYGRDGAYIYYFWLYWGGEAVNAVLGFKVIHEIFLDVFRPYHALKDLGNPVFKWAGLVMLIVSTVVAASNSFSQNPMVHAVTTLERAVHMAQLGLVLFLILFSRFLGVSRKQFSFGVALGFGVFAGSELLLLAMNAGGLLQQGSMNLMNMLAYSISAACWFAYSLMPQVARDLSQNRLRTQRWEQSIAALQPAGQNDSLIPMFETMVDQAFSRSSGSESPDDGFRPAPLRFSPRAKTAVAGSKARG